VFGILPISTFFASKTDLNRLILAVRGDEFSDVRLYPVTAFGFCLLLDNSLLEELLVLLLLLLLVVVEPSCKFVEMSFEKVDSWDEGIDGSFLSNRFECDFRDSDLSC
jgi:hypothetical protein